MTCRPPQSYRSGRTGPRSKIKFTNRSGFDPYQEERSVRCHASRFWEKNVCRPTRTYQFPDGDRCALYEFPVHRAFVRPYTLDDVIEALNALPRECVTGLKTIYLLGGSDKQSRCFHTGTYGTYRGGEICLHAYPRRKLVRRRFGPPAPHLVDEYARCGVECTQVGKYWVRRFRPASLRLFYLADVLVHEVGHHVDRNRLTAPQSESTSR